MKKVLMGLIGTSSISLAAALDVTASPSTGTNIFSDKGKIEVKGALVTTPSIVKYVVFASSTRTSDDMQDSLILPNMVLSFNDSENGFSGNKTPDKIYVKRTLRGVLKELTNADNVTFSLSGWDNDYTEIKDKSLAVSDSVKVPMTSFISKTKLISIAQEAYAGEGVAPAVLPSGSLILTSTSAKILRFPKMIQISHDTKGELKFEAVSDTSFSEPGVLTKEEAKPILDKFTNSVADKVSISVRVS